MSQGKICQQDSRNPENSRPWFCGLLKQQHAGNYSIAFGLAPVDSPSPYSGMRELPHTKSCFVCGEENPVGLRQRFETDGRVVRTHFTPRTEHAGFKGVIHGGILATLLDEIMVWACAVQTGKFGFCAEMTVRFQRPALPDSELVVEAELVENRRDRVFEAKADIRNEAGELLASATGKYMPIQDADFQALQEDLIGDANWLRTQMASPQKK
jgi:uncharacterized protein (TIGR00369 family)